MNTNRIYTGLFLAIFAITCLYFGYHELLYNLLNCAILYDSIYMYRELKLGINISSAFFIVMYLFHYYLLSIYVINPFLVLKIIIIAQISDVFQYISGTTIGRNKIGWISKNKTYEGYIAGLLMTVTMFAPAIYFCHLLGVLNNKDNNYDIIFSYCIYDIITIYVLGVIGGLLSSLFKRSVNIKDYSNLLGHHGGWLDRIDSIILPAIFKDILVNCGN